MSKHKMVSFNHSSYAITNNIKISVLSICPFCLVANNPVSKLIGLSKINDVQIAAISHCCSLCSKSSTTIQEITDKKGKIIAEYPLVLDEKFSANINMVSKGFVKMYNQASTSEQLSNFELAGMGYRSALEILIKDYALYFNLDTKENIAKLNLNRSIQTFFKDDSESLISADVVRILGNDFTHWYKNEEDNNSLEILKKYLEIFLKQIEVKMMIKHPPVSRKN